MRHILAITLFAVCAGIPSFARSQETTAADSAAAAIHAAYVAGDIPALQRWFADTLAFDGEVRVLTRRVEGKLALRDTSIRIREAEVLSPGWIAATLSAASMAQAYHELLAEIGRERFTNMVSARPWKVVKVDRAGWPYPATRPGDHIVILHLRGDRTLETLDEAVIFVLRDVEGEQRIVAHLADY